MSDAAVRGASDTKAEVLASIRGLRAYLDELASVPDDELTTRYALRRHPWPNGLYLKARRIAAELQAWFDALPVVGREAWPASLRHAPLRRSAPPLLVWGIGMERSTLRRACAALAKHPSFTGFAPVLVTDVADFAFFSRLAWLIEFVTPLSGEGECYALRKTQRIAKLYRGAPALPASACLELEQHADEIRRALYRSGG